MVNCSSALRVIVGVAMLAACSGCGTGRPATVAVTGTVTYQGRPVEGADVRFMGKSGPIATGTTDAQGRFTLRTFAAGDGAVPGEYTVLISKTEKVIDPRNPDNPYPLSRNLLPERYGNPVASGLTATVKSGEKNDFTFPLTD